LLAEDRARGIVIYFFADGLRELDGVCASLDIIPDHVHTLLCFNEPGLLTGLIVEKEVITPA